MTERERFIRTLTFNNPDRPSYGDYLYYQTTQERWEKEGLPKGLNRRALYDYFGFDHIDIWSDDCLPLFASSPALLPEFEREIIEVTSAYTVTREPSGDVIKRLKNVPSPAMPQFISNPVTDRKSWRDFKRRLDPESPGRLPADLQEIARRSPSRSAPLGIWLGGTYGLIRNWCGVENASYLFYDDAALVEEMVEHLIYFYSSLARKVFEAGVQLDWVMFWEDMAYNHASLLSPEMYRKYCLRFYKSMIGLARQYGVQVIMLDCDGNIEELIPLWLDAGVTVMHPMEAAAGMDVRKIRRQYGKKLAFLGGIDKRAIAMGREAIDAEVLPKLREIRDSGGGMICECDHGVPPDISLDNFRYFHDLVRNHPQ